MLWKKEKPHYQPYTTIYLQNSCTRGLKITVKSRRHPRIQETTTISTTTSPYNTTEEGERQSSERSLVRDNLYSFKTVLDNLNSYNHLMLWKITQQWIQMLRNSPYLVLLAYLFQYKLLERSKLDIINIKKSYISRLCL